MRSIRLTSHTSSKPSQTKTASAEPTDAQVKHLEFIQSVIARLATNSFLAKGWAITVAGALYGFAVSHLNPWIALLGVVPAVAFWWLDGYFLRAERLFRLLYDDARRPGTKVELFSMNVSPYQSDRHCSWRATIFSPTLRVFYGILLAIGLIIFTASIVQSTRPAHPARTTSARSSSVSSSHVFFGGHISPIPSSRHRGTR